MNSQHLDTIIIGQGLAGTTLAWRLLQYGQDIRIFDRENHFTCSKIAAGLVTPITGMRLVVSWRFQKLLQAAQDFYQQIEQQTGTRFFYQRGMIRSLTSQAEQNRFKEKLLIEEFRHLVQQPVSNFDRNLLSLSGEGFEMPAASQLHVRQYLENSQNAFRKMNCFQTACLDMNKDIVLKPDFVHLPAFNLCATRLIFCQGAEDRNNPWFPQLKFKPAQGEILTLNIPDLQEMRLINHKCWLAPMPGNQYAAGSTYQWNQLDSKPTEKGKQEIVFKLKQFLRCQFQIVDHRAAVRPALHDQKPVIGFHPKFKQIGIMNGLGSKGSLQAPWLAENFATHICTGKPIDPEVDLSQRYPL